MNQENTEDLKQRIKELEDQIKRLKTYFFQPSAPSTVAVPDALKPIFDKAQDGVNQYFQDVIADPAKGTIDISGERYLLIRASALAINFLDTIHKVYADRDPQEAENIGRGLLFDIAHTIGVNDARAMHKRMGLSEPIEKLSAGPVHFAYTGWAFVEIRPESNPVANDDFVIIYDHPYSFEAHSWLASGRQSNNPVCIMNAGYSSGWCEESFGIPLTAVEVSCRARGDKTCTFLMAPPHRIVERTKEFFNIDMSAPSSPIPTIPSYFHRKQVEERLKASEEQHRRLIENLGRDCYVYRHDTKRKYTYVSPSVTDVLGYTPEEYAKNIDNIITDNSANMRIFQYTANTLKGIAQPTCEVEVRHKDGSLRYLDIDEVPLRNKEGKIIALEGIAHNITARKRAEDALRESRQQLVNILEFYPDATVVIDAQGRITAWNKAIEKLTQVPAEDMLGKGNYEYALPFYGERRPILIDLALKADEDFEQKKYANLHRYGDSLVGEAYTPHLPGGRPYLYATASVLRDQNGKVIGAIESIRDITDRKNTEDALRESKQQLTNILEFYPDATVVIDAQGRITAWNKAIEKLTQVPAEDMLGKGNYEYALPFYGERRPILIDLALKTDEDFEQKKYANLHRSGDTIAGEAYTPHLPGGSLYLYATASVLRDADGKVIGAIESIRDITDRKKAEDELKHERDFRRTLIESNPSYFVAMKADGTTIMMNASMLQALGYTRQEAVGKDYLTTFIPERDRKVVHRVFQRILSSHEPVVATNRILTAAGEELLVEWRGRSIFKDNGELDYFFGIGTDITARQKAEEKLQQTLEELKRSNRELEEFAYVASHDLQEPLRKIMTFGDRLKTKFKDRLDEKGQDYLTRMQSAASRMQNLINDLLSYSRVTSKAKPFENVDLNLVIREVLEDLEVRINPAKDRIEVPDLPVIEADPRQMHQLFHNLLSNALKFRRPGQPSLVRIECMTKDSSYTIRISDNGVGFDEKHAESIFGIFKRLHSRSEYEGTGVGLAICKKIVERHGGTIKASSPPGQGAVFTISLPLIQVRKEEKS
jgi:PAS domain S-box-containing protein